ncbi:hypothetical protein FEM33_02650 [Dyadobacter flavalbus]|uniref:Uncharacterized protein n=1 Tax=Dyadobacter flavalbus TaxID=2579942 RepID=A0A5M8R1I5_9BACT|nr:hypothetical protein [Dyadobacter flavalbus]KAA6441428.1 hypothetical protein FEM33_02650 [Dyadobacter flavalbus]
MTNLRTIILLLLFSFYGILGCGIKKIEKNIILDVSKYNKIKFTGMEGDEISIKFKGVFTGRIKKAMTGNSDKLTAGNFTIYENSIDFDMGTMTIYQDNTGFTWYIRPVGPAKGKISVSIIESRVGRIF